MFFQWIVEPKIPSRDRVSISPRSCVDFDRCAQAEIVCRFRRDRVSISPGDRLGFVGCRLRFWNLRRGGELLERGRFVLRKMTRTVKGLSRKSATRDDGRNSSRKQAAAAKQVLRSTGPVDRTCTTCTGLGGRPDRSTAGA